MHSPRLVAPPAASLLQRCALDAGHWTLAAGTEEQQEPEGLDGEICVLLRVELVREEVLRAVLPLGWCRAPLALWAGVAARAAIS